MLPLHTTPISWCQTPPVLPSAPPPHPVLQSGVTIATMSWRRTNAKQQVRRVGRCQRRKMFYELWFRASLDHKLSAENAKQYTESPHTPRYTQEQLKTTLTSDRSRLSCYLAYWRLFDINVCKYLTIFYWLKCDFSANLLACLFLLSRSDQSNS